ncbi:hypothetical protein FA95DRAFT_1683878 [Auriscalpium vulgare]|uniref:Uncharacterized protein n=1 Tax=Auriscalpium vulgare TaxID=40419 RepID=A0ACB8R8P3_9AGAM|nr:hypothetical protein FA95DRAFT_1683878 [Auriscalpium vulgare]
MSLQNEDTGSMASRADYDIRKTLQGEIDATRRHLSKLCSQLNALSPIGTLPTEVLARIFEYHRVQQPFAPAQRTAAKRVKTVLGPGRALKFLGWIATTHVSRRWREVALGHHLLWSVVPLDMGPFWADLMLERAHLVPLEIVKGPNTSLRHWHLTKLTYIVTHHLHHIRTLDLQGLQSEQYDRQLKMKEALSSLLFTQSGAPCLETLSLRADDTDMVPCLPPTIFANTVPMLKTVVLVNFPLPWTSLTRGQFTNLHIEISQYCSHSNMATIHVPPMEQVIDVLEHSPALQHLHLERCLSEPLDKQRDLLTHLHYLESLTIVEEIWSIIDFMDRIVAPSSAKLNIRCVRADKDTRMQDFTDLITLITSHFGGNPDAILQSVALQYSLEDLPFQVCAWRSLSAIPMKRKAQRSEGPDLLLAIEAEEIVLAMATKIILHGLPLSGMQRLDLDVCYEIFETEDWVDLLGRYEALCYLRLRLMDVSEAFASALAPPQFRSKPSRRRGRDIPRQHPVSQGVLLFPRLEHLSLFGVNIRGRHNLAESFRLRRLGGKQLTLVDITASYCDEEEESEWLTVAAKVEVNKNQYESSENDGDEDSNDSEDSLDDF